MNKKDFRIAFMGTPEFALESLKKIIEENFQVVCVVTATDKPAGRGKKISESAIKKFAIQNNIPVLQPPNLKDIEFINDLNSFHAHLNVVVAFRMLPEAVWAMPPDGTINLHASLLPDYRGAAPINRVIINGEKKTGLSTFFIEKDIDTGKIILQKEIQIPAHMNAGELHDTLMVEGATLLIKTIVLIISGNVSPKPQSHVKVPKTAPKIHSEDCKIPWNKNANTIYNHIRGLSPFPGAWTEVVIQGREIIKVKIFETTVISEVHKIKVGSIISDNKTYLKVAVDGGFL
ncbi:MAG: methionyl-tRNA formyltransferase, partial [Bacteroidales bacterium]|nr:methionyl-tRNA formyltransferase [Bacteroidales bacterium]